MNERKPILCLDFDGVIHDYREGWRGGEIYGEVTPGFFSWAERAFLFFELVVYSSRSSDPKLGPEMEQWLISRYRNWRHEQILSGAGAPADVVKWKFADKKPPAFITIDDRALQFWGDWDQFDPKQLRGFTPWMVSREPQRLTYSKPKDQEGNFEKVCHDMHEALGVKWGDDVYAEIARLKLLAAPKPPTDASIIAGYLELTGRIAETGQGAALREYINTASTMTPDLLKKVRALRDQEPETFAKLGIDLGRFEPDHHPV